MRKTRYFLCLLAVLFAFVASAHCSWKMFTGHALYSNGYPLEDNYKIYVVGYNGQAQFMPTWTGDTAKFWINDEGTPSQIPAGQYYLVAIKDGCTTLYSPAYYSYNGWGNPPAYPTINGYPNIGNVRFQLNPPNHNEE